METRTWLQCLFNVSCFYRLVETHNVVAPTGKVDARIQFQGEERTDADNSKDGYCQDDLLAVSDEVEVVYIKDGFRESGVESKFLPPVFFKLMFVNQAG